MRHLLILACLAFVTAATAEEADFDFKSLGARKAMRDYKATLVKEDKAKQKAIEEIEAEAKKARKTNRVELIMNLEQALKKALQDADLEEANKISDAIKALKKGASPAGASVAGSTGRKRKARIPRNAVKWNGHRYLIIQKGVTWHQAKEACERMGGHLVRIEDSAENDFVRSLHKKAGVGLVSYDLWTDVSKEQDDVWRFSTGKKIAFADWQPGFPYDWKTHSPFVIGGFAHHVFIGFKHEGIRWGNYPSGIRMPFICEWDE